MDTPNVVANAVLAENRTYETGDPVTRLLRDLGLGAAFRLLTTGEVNPETVAAYAEALIADAEAVAPDSTPPDGDGPVLSDSNWIALQQICEE